ncbi:MAG TPA: class I SAM-dependent methyltransferase [Flavobacteriales bacterium]|nr:class I SAM-dependent methyltransferase [Flavobacteriales bacterium]
MADQLAEVKDFWEGNPLFSGESDYDLGSHEFFQDHSKAYYDDVFAGSFDANKFIPMNLKNANVLDLGCGVGFWTIEIQKHRQCKSFYCGDLTQKALDTTQKRLDLNEMAANLSIQNAEQLTYESNFFDHINCQGVIHHTPNTDNAIKEIARVLKKDGTASISVYYRNFLLRNWTSFSIIGKLLSKLGGGLKGRGRENIFSEKNPDEITRLYDGDKNPIGKSYTKNEIIEMVSPYFHVNKTFPFFFPARSIPFSLPRFLHRWLSNYLGFMIHLNLIKK